MDDEFAMISKRARIWLATVTLAVSAEAAHAEAMDKEPTLASVWVWAVAGAVLGLVLPSLRPWLAAGTLPLAAYRPLAAALEVWDRYVGPEILREAGPGYGIQVHAAVLLVLLAHAVGLFFGIRRRRSFIRKRLTNRAG